MDLIEVAQTMRAIEQREAGTLRPRVVIVHSLTRDLFDEASVAHAFGPFDSADAAQAFEDAGSDEDRCFKLVLVVVGPSMRDIIATHPDFSELGSIERPDV